MEESAVLRGAFAAVSSVFGATSPLGVPKVMSSTPFFFLPFFDFLPPLARELNNQRVVVSESCARAGQPATGREPPTSGHFS